MSKGEKEKNSKKGGGMMIKENGGRGSKENC